MSSARLYHHRSYFDQMYARSEDPWGFESRWYERRKYAITMAVLPRERYSCAFEPGCANGAVTLQLQARCNRLIACELVPEAARRAQQRMRRHRHVDVRVGAFPACSPDEEIDLLVLSEIAYYLTPAGLRHAETAIDDMLVPGGDLVAVHYTGATDYPMAGSDVSTWIDGLPWLERLVRHVDRDFDAGVWRRRDRAATEVMRQSDRPATPNRARTRVTRNEGHPEGMRPPDEDAPDLGDGRDIVKMRQRLESDERSKSQGALVIGAAG